MTNHWRGTRTISDLGQTMALWLEGRIDSWPGYDGPFGQEEENGARHLIPTLATLNRAGFVTTHSQPGTVDQYGRQRACVSGTVHDRSPLLGRLLDLQQQGFTVLRGWPRQATVITEDDGRPFTFIGGFHLRRDETTRTWRGIGRQALRELKQHGAEIHVIDMQWGRDNRLWTALTGVTR
ncbi:DUF6919 domain-containing protein [Streptomyces sp. NPDC059534]|uniref:DUF6919 domain-containing protein n=1 Tax=Streptomyces sp. NPDC059534 TaxID=3346859 RepID=UPI0036C422D4